MPDLTAQHDTEATTGPHPALDAAALELVRFRLGLVVAATALLAGLAAALVAVALHAGPGSVVGGLLRWPALPLLALAAAVVVAGLLTVALARRVVAPVEDLGVALRHYGALYASARVDALQDSLTGLGNHRAFQEEFDRQLDAVRRYGQRLALLLIDLDDFKTINDSAGHATGDAVLAEVGRLLRGGLRRSDRPFRVGGDEFAVLMPETSAEEAALVGRRILSSCLEPRRDSAFDRGFSFSGGIATAPDMSTVRTELQSMADDALYRCKRGGRTGVHVFDPSHDERPLDGERLRRASESIVRIVAADAVVPAFQPIVDLETGRVTAFEGLARPAPGSAFADAGSLFAMAEASGRTADLDWLCARAILAGARDLRPDQALHVNLSPQTVTAPEFGAGPLLALVTWAGLTPDRVVLELTERQAVEDVDALRARLAACRRAGFRIAIDDVGAGNAGLRLLSQIHFDIVKVDLSLVQAGAQREASLDVVRSLADLARRWGAQALAEGLETTAQLAMVRSIGLLEGQGYLLGRPQPRADLATVDLDGLLAEQGAPGFLRALAATG